MSNSTDPESPSAVISWEIPTAVDNAAADEDPVVSCIPESGSTFTIGVTNVTCEAVDTNGNRATCDFSVNVTGTYGSGLGVISHMTYLKSPKYWVQYYLEKFGTIRVNILGQECRGYSTYTSPRSPEFSVQLYY